MSDKFLKFPKGFLWGGATASEQAEGRGNIEKGLTTWDKFFEVHPEMFYQGIGPDVTNDFINRYKEDIKMFAGMGANSIRLGFSWARLFPDGKTLNQEAVDFYHDVIKECKDNKIELIMTIFHFDMPLWAQDMGGFESLEVIEKYAELCDFIFQEYGNEVKYFATMNEPIVPVICGYLFKKHWPMVVDEKRAVQAAFGTVLAHAKAVNIFNEKYKEKTGANIGVVINVAPAYAKDGENFTEEDRKAADMNNMLHNYSMLDSMILGKFPEGLKEFCEKFDLLPEYTQDHIKEISKVKIDFVGTNYYGPGRVEHEPNPEGKLAWEKVARHHEWKQCRKNVFRGWEIYPKAIYDTAQIIKTRYNNMPFFISENGMGVQKEWLYRDEKSGEIQDDYRIAFVQEHLMWLHKAIEEGAQCFGYLGNIFC